MQYIIYRFAQVALTLGLLLTISGPRIAHAESYVRVSPGHALKSTITTSAFVVTWSTTWQIAPYGYCTWHYNDDYGSRPWYENESYTDGTCHRTDFERNGGAIAQLIARLPSGATVYNGPGVWAGCKFSATGPRSPCTISGTDNLEAIAQRYPGQTLRFNVVAGGVQGCTPNQQYPNQCNYTPGGGLYSLSPNPPSNYLDDPHEWVPPHCEITVPTSTYELAPSSPGETLRVNVPVVYDCSVGTNVYTSLKPTRATGDTSGECMNNAGECDVSVPFGASMPDSYAGTGQRETRTYEISLTAHATGPIASDVIISSTIN